MRVTRPREIGSNKPPCVALVRIAAGAQTRAAQARIYQAKKRGLPPEQCGVTSDYLIDGQPMCRHHAGGLALAHLEQKP